MSDIDLEKLQQNLLISFRVIAILLTNQDKKRFSIEFWKLANCEKKEWQLCKFLALNAIKNSRSSIFIFVN